MRNLNASTCATLRLRIAMLLVMSNMPVMRRTFYRSELHAMVMMTANTSCCHSKPHDRLLAEAVYYQSSNATQTVNETKHVLIVGKQEANALL
jgi:hypothetical protein